MMNKLEISEIQIYPIKPKEGLIAFSSFIINNQLFIGNVAIYTRPTGEGYRLVYPTRQLPNGKTITVVHPINAQTGLFIEKLVIEKFEEVIKK